MNIDCKNCGIEADYLVDVTVKDYGFDGSHTEQWCLKCFLKKAHENL